VPKKFGPGDAERRFWERVVKADGDGCWEWTGARLPSGYGYLWNGAAREYAHRFAWRLEHGPIPPGLEVRHRCDNRACVRHTLLGTHAENMADMVARGRNPKGEATRLAKLTEDNVMELRRRVAAGEPAAAVGREFGICDTQASRIARGLRWAHLPLIPVNGEAVFRGRVYRG
jgi:hypothetical protein